MQWSRNTNEVNFTVNPKGFHYGDLQDTTLFYNKIISKLEEEFQSQIQDEVIKKIVKLIFIPNIVEELKEKFEIKLYKTSSYDIFITLKDTPTYNLYRMPILRLHSEDTVLFLKISDQEFTKTNWNTIASFIKQRIEEEYKMYENLPVQDLIQELEYVEEYFENEIENLHI